MAIKVHPDKPDGNVLAFQRLKVAYGNEKKKTMTFFFSKIHFQLDILKDDKKRNNYNKLGYSNDLNVRNEQNFFFFDFDLE